MLNEKISLVDGAIFNIETGETIAEKDPVSGRWYQVLQTGIEYLASWELLQMLERAE